jgi:hypothetical protein
MKIRVKVTKGHPYVLGGEITFQDISTGDTSWGRVTGVGDEWAELEFDDDASEWQKRLMDQECIEIGVGFYPR